MTAQESERLAAMEAKVDGLCERTERMEGKLDKAIENKADKSEVKELRARIDKAVGWAATVGILTFIGLLVYLLESHI